MNKKDLEDLYSKHSISEIAKLLGKSRSSVYRLLIQNDIKPRTKSEAQKNIKGHQRLGKHHSFETKEKISLSCESYWKNNQRAKGGERPRKNNLAAMNNAAKPKNGQLSKLGSKLLEFLEKKEQVRSGIRLTRGRASDIVLVDKKLVIELSMPFEVFAIDERYEVIIDKLNKLGYKVLVVQQVSNSISLSRCRKIYEQVLWLLKSEQKSKIVRI
jgi:hypothetical protein